MADRAKRAKRAGIFYFSQNGGADFNPIDEIYNPYPVGYVRVEVVHVKTLEEALDMARPHADESVMNAHWLSDDY